MIIQSGARFSESTIIDKVFDLMSCFVGDRVPFCLVFRVQRRSYGTETHQARRDKWKGGR